MKKKEDISVQFSFLHFFIVLFKPHGTEKV